MQAFESPYSNHLAGSTKLSLLDVENPLNYLPRLQPDIDLKMYFYVVRKATLGQLPREQVVSG